MEPGLENAAMYGGLQLGQLGSQLFDSGGMFHSLLDTLGYDSSELTSDGIGEMVQGILDAPNPARAIENIIMPFPMTAALANEVRTSTFAEFSTGIDMLLDKPLSDLVGEELIHTVERNYNRLADFSADTIECSIYMMPFYERGSVCNPAPIVSVGSNTTYWYTPEDIGPCDCLVTLSRGNPACASVYNTIPMLDVDSVIRGLMEQYPQVVAPYATMARDMTEEVKGALRQCLK